MDRQLHLEAHGGVGGDMADWVAVQLEDAAVSVGLVEGRFLVALAWLEIELMIGGVGEIDHVGQRP